MLTIKGDRIAVMATRSVVTLTETDCVISECYESSLHQMQSGVQLRISGKSGRFIFPGFRRFIGAENYRSLAAYIFWHEQIRTHKFVGLRLKREFPQNVSV